MAWATPPTFVVGQVLTAAQQNILSANLTSLHSSLDHVTLTTNASATATTEGTANTILAGTSQAYSTNPTRVAFFAPDVAVAPENDGTFVLLRGATVLAGIWGKRHDLAGAQTERKPIYLEFYDTSPPGGTYAYTVKAFVGGGTLTVSAGAGGSGTLAPAFLRVTDCAN